MSKVVDLASYRKPKQVDLTNVGGDDFKNLIIHLTEEVLDEWQKFAKTNRLNEYFIQSISKLAQPNVNYLSSLNDISKVEKHLRMSILVMSPHADIIGWKAGFLQDDYVVNTTENHFTEEYARCFNILLFLKLSRELKKQHAPN